MRRGLKSGLALLLALVALGLAGCSGEEPTASEAPDYEAALSGAPPRLNAIHAQANELIAGGMEAYEKRIAELRGLPVVVNIWASWCGPCRAEFPHLQQVSARFGKRVAFLGVDSADLDESAADFLVDNPVPYPSYTDPDRKITTALGAVGLPATVFYDRQGRSFTKQGFYASEQDLIADIRRYALRKTS